MLYWAKWIKTDKTLKTYTTKQGDMWDGIAFSQLGDTVYTNALIEANLQYRDYFSFPAGIVSTLPEKTEKGNAATFAAQGLSSVMSFGMN